MAVIESAGITDVGRKREGNEDALIVDDVLGVYVVADGLGGHQAGEVASRLVVETVQDYIRRRKEGSEVDKSANHRRDLSKEANFLLSSIRLANERVYEASTTEESCRGMGSTVSAVYFTEETLIAANVGDSPIYLIHDGNIDLLSVPHTVKAELEGFDPKGTMKSKEKFGHILTRAVGIGQTVKADTCEIPCYKDDIVVISSDGLSNKVSPEEIRDVAGEQRPNESCRTLVDLANERGGEDNVTVIVLRIISFKHKKGGITRLVSWLDNGFRKLSLKPQ